jgi:4-oxalocrotonate tautomerase
VPIVRIDIEAGKSAEYRRALLAGVRRGIVAGLGVGSDRVTQRIVETPAANIDNPDAKSDRYTVVEVSMLPGRGPELKASLYRAIAEQLAADPGITATDLVVLVRDPEAECFYLNGSVAGAQPADLRTGAGPEASGGGERA